MHGLQSKVNQSTTLFTPSNPLLFYLFCSAPFDVSLIVLLVMIVCIITLWSENYGDKTVDHIQSYKNAINNVRTGAY